MPMPPTPDVSIVLPVYNERGHLEDEINRIRKTMDESPYSYEVVVVDDGSSDGSSEVLHEFEGIRLLHFAHNRGSGSARRYGSQAARGRIVVWTDVDMSYPNEMIPDLIIELDRGWDQVVGARTSEQGTAKLLRRFAKWFINKLGSYLTGTDIPDMNSGLRAFRKDVAAQFLHLLPSGFSCVTTITMTFLANGYSVKYIPIPYYPRAGRSKFHWWSDTRRYVVQVIRMTLSFDPLRVFGPISVVLGLTGVGKLIYDLIDKNFRVATNTLVVLGVTLAVVLLGVVADLLVQLNRKPHDVMPARVRWRSPS
jgi:polyisoprenyl-phosphate glycosyltransferase